VPTFHRVEHSKQELTRLQLHFSGSNSLTGEDDGDLIVPSGFNLVQDSRALL
jgi:hypothetical protein